LDGGDITPVFVTVFSHNERTLQRYERYRSDPAQYAIWRSAMIDVARLLHDRGVHYSWQSDYLMMDAIDAFEADALAADPTETDGLPILQYFVDVLGVSIEVHAHECRLPDLGDCTDKPYNYADVAYTIEAYGGVAPAPVIGGSSEAERTVDDFAGCIDGNVFDYRWCPTILIGFAGAQGGHQSDDHHSGVWRPSGFDPVGFVTDDPAGIIVNVGRGYSLGAFSQATMSDVAPLEFTQGLVERLGSGEAEPGRIYTETINFNEDALISNDLLPQISALLDDLEPLAADGRIVYANFPEVVAAWETYYNSEPNIYSYAD